MTRRALAVLLLALAAAGAGCSRRSDPGAERAAPADSLHATGDSLEAAPVPVVVAPAEAAPLRRILRDPVLVDGVWRERGAAAQVSPLAASDWTTGWVEPMRYFPVPLSFAAPGDSTGIGGWRACASYEVQLKRPDGSTAVIPVWRDSSIAVPAVPAAPGSPERVWVLHDTTSNWRTGGTTYRLRGVDGAGNRPEWSNAVVLAVSAYLPDTIWTLRRGDGPSMSPVAGGEWQFRRERNPAGWMVSWDLAPGDTVAGAYVEHFEGTQGRHLAALRALYGYACRRGVRDSAWVTP